MKIISIKKYLKRDTVFRRSSSISNAFASALAPFDKFDPVRVARAVSLLGQDPRKALKCVYCEKRAATWDHLVSIVKDREFRGYGHQIGNLVPACRSCNESKGAKDASEFLMGRAPSVRRRLAKVLKRHQKLFSNKLDVSSFKKRRPTLWRRYQSLRSQILSKMKEADAIASQLRSSVAG